MSTKAIPIFADWQLARPEWLMLLVAAAVVPLAVLLLHKLRKRRLSAYAHPERITELAGTPRRHPVILRVLLLCPAIALLAIALAQPQSDPVEVDTERTGRDVVFMLDVSRSMLASDVAPSRLERAKLWIKDLVAELQGERFALVAFAGSATIRAPLTADHLFFDQTLDELRPDAVSRGGTNIGDAIRKTLELVIPERDDRDAAGFTDLIIITDGEDQQSLPVQAAQAAAQRGVRIIAIGIGSTDGASITASDGSPDTVRTRLDSDTLAQIASASPANAYLEVGTGTLDLPGFYRDLIASAEQTALEQTTTLRYTERFMWFMWPAFALLALERLTARHTRSMPW